MTTLLSDRIVEENQVLWRAMQGHRFVQDIQNDTLPDGAFRRYLVYEAAFVETAISIFSYAVIKAERIEQRRWLIGVLDALANEQMAYFERTFEGLGIDPADFGRPTPAVRRFDQGMLRIASDGSFTDIVAAMFAAEWTYWHWCSTAARSPISNDVLAAWVRLHAESTFSQQAHWLKRQLDDAGSGLGEDDARRHSAIFGEVLQLEIDFHSAAYGSADEGDPEQIRSDATETWEL